MIKSYTQQRLEVQREADIREIVMAAFRRAQAHRNMVTLVAVDLGITAATLYNWCRELGISIDDYRKQEVSA